MLRIESKVGARFPIWESGNRTNTDALPRQAASNRTGIRYATSVNKLITTPVRTNRVPYASQERSESRRTLVIVRI